MYIYIYTDHIQIHVSIIMHAPVDDLTRLDIHLAQPRKSYNLQHYWEFRYLFTAYAQASGSRTIRASRSGELSMCPRAGGKPVKTEDWNDGVEVWRIFQYFPYFIILHCFIILHQMFIISYPSLSKGFSEHVFERRRLTYWSHWILLPRAKCWKSWCTARSRRS